MKNKLASMVVGIALCLLPSWCLAEAFGLKRAVESALSLNPELTTAKSQEKASGFDRESAEWARYPKLTVSNEPTTNPSTSVTTPMTTTRLEQPLWAGGRIDGLINSARSQEIAQKANTEVVRQDLAERTVASYMALNGALIRQKTATDAILVFENLVDYVRRRQTVGVASASDVTQAGVRKMQVQVLREQLVGESNQALAQIQALTMSNVTQTYPVKVKLLTNDELAAAEQYLTEESPLIQQRRAQLDAAKSLVEQKSAGVWPTLTARVEEINTSFYKYSRAGFVLQYTPDAGLATLSQIKSAQAQADGAQEKLRSDQVAAQLKVRTLTANYLSAREQMANWAEQIQDLERNVESFLRQFEAGRKTWLEVLAIHRELVDAKIAQSRAQEQMDVSALRLMSAAGNLLTWIDGLTQ
jgi:adhesin transport system outer membrane protein